MSSAELRWTAVLSEMQSSLDELDRRLLAGEVTGVQPFVVPGDLPPLPVGCAALAREVARRHDQVVARVRERLAVQPTRAPRDLSRSRTADRASRFEARA